MHRFVEPKKSELPLLIVEDDDADYEAMLRAFEKSGIRNPVFRCLDGDDALDRLYARGKHAGASRPGLVFLDLHLPGTDGHEVLATIKSDEALRSIPVLILTASPDEEDIAQSYKAGANTYLVKPSNPGEMLAVVDAIRDYWLGEYVVIKDRYEKWSGYDILRP